MLEIAVDDDTIIKAKILVTWTSLLVNEGGFTKNELTLIARSLPRTVINKSGVQIYLKEPRCIARIYSTGRIVILGRIDENQALRHLKKITKKLKHKIFWEPINDSFPVDLRVNIPLKMLPLGPVFRFIERPDINFDQSKVKIDQLGAEITLNKNLQLEKIAKHESLRMRVAEIRGELHVRLPTFDKYDENNISEDIISNNPTAIIYRSGYILILGYRKKGNILSAIKFLWESLN